MHLICLQEQREERAVLYEKEKEFEIKDAEAERERELYRQRVRQLFRGVWSQIFHKDVVCTCVQNKGNPLQSTVIPF